jgi:hypothetical protein
MQLRKRNTADNGDDRKIPKIRNMSTSTFLNAEAAHSSSKGTSDDSGPHVTCSTLA